MGRTTVDVRTAGPQDAEAVLELSDQARREAGAEVRALATGHRDRVDATLTRPDVQVLLAWMGPTPVGLLVLRRGELIPLSGPGAVHVEQLWVAPPWRGRGVARALLVEAAGVGERSGAERVVCSVPTNDRDAARFLTRLGFAPVVTYRMVSVSGLLRRLAGENPSLLRRSALDQTIARRRRQARERVLAAAVPSAGGAGDAVVDLTDAALAGPDPSGPDPVGAGPDLAGSYVVSPRLREPESGARTRSGGDTARP